MRVIIEAPQTIPALRPKAAVSAMVAVRLRMLLKMRFFISNLAPVSRHRSARELFVRYFWKPLETLPTFSHQRGHSCGCLGSGLAGGMSRGKPERDHRSVFLPRSEE